MRHLRVNQKESIIKNKVIYKNLWMQNIGSLLLSWNRYYLFFIKSLWLADFSLFVTYLKEMII